MAVTRILGAPGLRTTDTPLSPAPVVVPSELPQLVWVSAAGSETWLSAEDNGFIYMPGATGLDLPPMSLTTTVTPALDGQILRGVRADMRTITLPLYVEADTRAELRKKIRDLGVAVDPRSGDGFLKVMEADGSVRQIAARYSDGLLGDEGTTNAGLHFRMFVLTFVAPDPFWTDTSAITQVWEFSSSVREFIPLLLPLLLQSSSVLGDVVITNDGDEPAYPKWTITGPMTAVTISNNTTGEDFTITQTLTSGQFITVDCDPSKLTVVQNDGTNRWPQLSADPDLWQLPPGDNDVSLSVSGASSGSRVQLDYTRRWKTS